MSTYLQLAQQALRSAKRIQHFAQHHPEDYRADLAARTFAHDALNYARQAEQPPPPPLGLIIRRS